MLSNDAAVPPIGALSKTPGVNALFRRRCAKFDRSMAKFGLGPESRRWKIGIFGLSYWRTVRRYITPLSAAGLPHESTLLC
jgi:hypothetical protein